MSRRTPLLLLAASPLLAALGCGGGALPQAIPDAPAGDPIVLDNQEEVRSPALIGKALLPDLMTQIPEDLVVSREGPEYFLRLTNTYTNAGMGDMRLLGETIGTETHAIQHILDAADNTVATYDVSTFEYHAAHGHWHINNVALYELRKGSPNGPRVAEASKVTFCMIDLQHQYPDMPNGSQNGEYFSCNGEYQGLSVGWSDVYHQGLEGQAINITSLPRGIYYLVSTVDPTGQFIERDDFGEGVHANNPAWVKVWLHPTRRIVQVLDSGLGEPTFRK